MAGHSKWANIKHRKAAADAKRGKIFTRLIKEITVAARLGGPDPGSNARLRLAMDKAYDNNMPKDTVERATKRGAGELDGVSYEEIRYEGYGIGGAAVMVDCMTDNRMRTVADARASRNSCATTASGAGTLSRSSRSCASPLSRWLRARSRRPRPTFAWSPGASA